jgi:TonB family protein
MQAVASASKAMEFGRQWQGQMVDGRFPLDQYLGGSEDKAVFLTKISGGATKAAIKLVRAGTCDADAQLTAWRRATKLSHPNLVRIFDGGRCWLGGSDLLFVVTEFAEESLGQVLPQRALSTEEVDATLPPVLDALAYVHGQGLVHGHIRPSNIMAVHEQLKLSSDGIQAPGPQPQKSAATLYDAPEAARGQLSPAADVWSLGATLAEMLTQRVPRRDDANLKLQQPFADIVNHALSEDPAARWTVADIQARIAGKKVAAPKTTAVPKNGATAKVAAAASVASVPRNVRQPQPGAEKSRMPFIVAGIVVVAIIAVALLLMRSSSTQTTEPSANSSSLPAVPTESSTGSSNANTATPSQPANTGSGRVMNRVLPTPSRSALNTIHGTIKVRVKVKVDPSGSVTHASFVTSGPSQYFSRLAMQAAQQWKFAPGASGEHTLLFAYKRSGVEASE